MPQAKQKSKQKAKKSAAARATAKADKQTKKPKKKASDTGPAKAKKAAKKPAAKAKKAAKTAARKLAKRAEKTDKKAKKTADKATKKAKKTDAKAAKKANAKAVKKAVKKATKKSDAKATKKAAKKSDVKATRKAAKKSDAKATKKAAKKSADKAKKLDTKAARKSDAKAKKTAGKPAKPAKRRAAPGPATDAVLAAQRFYALPVDAEAFAASEEGLTLQTGDDLVAAHFERNFGYFGAIDKTLSGFYVLDDEGDNYYLADLRDSGQVWWQDHETREVSLAFASVEDYAGYREARAAASDDEDADDDEIADRFRPRKLKSTGERRPSTAKLLERYQWLVWLFARSHELRGQILEQDADLVNRAYGHLRGTFATRAAEAKAFAAERGRLADDPHLGIYWLLHTSVLADHARRDEVVAALDGSEHPLVHAFVAAFGALAHDGDVPAAPGFRVRRSRLLFLTGGALTSEEVDRERLTAALFADPVNHGFIKAERLVDAAAAADELQQLHDLVAAGLPGPELGWHSLAALLDVRAGVQASRAADTVLKDMNESTDVDLLADVLELLAPVATDREQVRALIDSVLARDPFHWGVLEVGKVAAERDLEVARAEQFIARIAPLAEVRPLLLEIFSEDDDERGAALKRLRELPPAQQHLLARRLLVMASQIAGDALAVAVDVLLGAGDPDALAELARTVEGLQDPSQFAEQLVELREAGIVDLADPLLPIVQGLLLRPESDGFMADHWKEALVEKLAPVAHEPVVFDWLLAALEEDSRHSLRDDILSKLFIAYNDNQVVARLSEAQASRLIRLAARLGVKPADADAHEDGVFPAIHVYHAAGRVLFYFDNPGGLPAIAEVLAQATDVELLSNLYSALAHIKTEDSLGLLRSRLFVEQRQVWNLCNAVAETFDDEGHAEVMAELERTRSDHGANSYAVVFIDFANDTKKKPHTYVAQLARAVLGWPEPTDPRARGQRKFVLMHAVRLGLESADHELVRLAHPAALAIAEPPFSNLAELHYENATEDPWGSLKARDRKLLDRVLAGEVAGPRKLDEPVKKIDDDTLAELAGVPVDRRFLTTPDGEVWFFDKQDRLHVFDGQEVRAPSFTVVRPEDLGAFLAGVERCDGHVVQWNSAAGEFRDIARYGDRVLIFEGVNNGPFTATGLIAAGAGAADVLYHKLVDHLAKDWFVADAWYVPGLGGVQRTFYAPLPGGKYNDERDRLHELEGTPAALADAEARALALMQRPGARVACIEWMDDLRRRSDMGLLEYFSDRARDDEKSPRWHLEAFAEFEQLLNEWDWASTVPGLSVSHGAPPDDDAIARFAAAAGAEVPEKLRDAWAHGPLAWQIGEQGLALLGPDEALARGPALAAAAEGIAAQLPPADAEALRKFMAGAQVVIEDAQQRPVVLFVPKSPQRGDGRVFVEYDVAGPPEDLWFEGSFEWFIAESLGRPFVKALGEACPELLGLPYGARRHEGVVRRRYVQGGKFWEVVFDPEAGFVLTRSGKAGAAGSHTLRRFTSPEQAQANFEKQVKGRTRDGWRLAT
ncbi:WGR domain-containing protein [Nannocystis bainbridge]|uniref:WGR domain-containing protein n=1 Tax=Nannocystis bainbridge TaxID=2995303 RepID=A0ABT5DY28_9BACT|nr:WGR domain-containing protein [Nannocystis bainbridge]MDC0718055.1 WGR domain-containing protein [Nannocystis bainbridge]